MTPSHHRCRTYAEYLKILGVTISNKLSVNDHVSNIVSKCSQTVYALTILRAHCLCDTALQLSSLQVSRHHQVAIRLLLLLLFSSFSTIRAGLRCRASCWVQNRFPEYTVLDSLDISVLWNRSIYSSLYLWLCYSRLWLTGLSIRVFTMRAQCQLLVVKVGTKYRWSSLAENGVRLGNM